ncbi:kinase-like domain-containing protein [Trichoderma austrokoningii]
MNRWCLHTSWMIQTPKPLAHSWPLRQSLPSFSLRTLQTLSRCLRLPKSSGGELVERISGSYNIVHVVELKHVKLVIRVPATGWGSGMTPTAAHAMESQVATIRLIRSKITIPVPEIYALDTTDNDDIGAPYMCMGFIPSKPVSEVWFDRSGALPREELRLRILTSLSRNMAQLSCLAFDKMRSIMEDGSGSTVIGPCYDWDEKADGSIQVTVSGPFDSTSAFLQQHSIATSNETLWRKAEAKVLKAMVDYLPTLDSPPGFVLCLPDFDSQNVMVDDKGTVTGLIDWDLVQTVPRFVGYARYPGWITRDWDPLMYGWPEMTESEVSPETLGQYREHYNKELGKALKSSGDWKFTEKSHVAEAIWIAALHRINRLEICRKFVQVAGDDTDSLNALYAIGEGDYGEDKWNNFKANLKRLMP